MSRRDTDGMQTEEADSSLDEPVFEVITTIRTRLKDAGSGNKADSKQVVSLLSKPQYHINIYSAAVINALQSVVKYYPSQSLSGDPVRVDWPYPVLAHHYDELIDFRNSAADKGSDSLCHLEKHVVEHLDLLLAFLDEQIMTQVREEQERNKRGTYSWELAWVGLKPGVTIATRWRGAGDWASGVVHSVTDGIFVDPPRPWMVYNWSVRYDGRFLGRLLTPAIFDKFDGESKPNLVHFLGMDRFDPENVDGLPEDVKQKIDFGRKYLKLLEKQSRHFKGPSRAFPFNEVRLEGSQCLSGA